MKLKLLFLCIIAGLVASAQNPPNYPYRATRERTIAHMDDSTTHIAAGATPSLRVGGSPRAGAIFVDSSGAGKGFYYYSDGIFKRVADYDSLGNRVTSIRRSNDSVFYCIYGSCTFAYKDSTGSGQNFGKVDTIFSENRHVNGRGLYTFLFDSIPDFQISDANGTNRFQVANVRTKIFSASGNSSIEIGDTLSFTADQYHVTDLPEASNMTDKTVMVWDSVTTHLQRISKDSIGGGSGTAAPDSLLDRFNQIPEHGIVFSPTDTLVFITDSYGSGTGATTPSTDGYVQKLNIKLGSPILSLYAVSGSTVMKRTPQDYNGTANLIDRLPGFPSGASNKKLAAIAMGLNDLGQTAAAYSVANFKTDYDSVIRYLTTVKGWNPRKILLIAPYYIGQAGYNAYSVITGNAAATPQRHRDFVYTVKRVAQEWGCLFLDIYNDQLQNDTTLMNADAIHANTAGHDYISKAVFNYIAGTSQSSNFNFNSTYRILTPKGALYTGLSTTTPFQINLGGNYYSTPGTPAFSTKFITYYDGSPNNTTGIGASTDGQEYHSFGNHNIYTLAARVATFGTSLNQFFNTTEIAKLGTGSTQMLKLDHASSYAAAGNETYISYESVNTELGRQASYYDGTGFGNKTYVHSGSVLQVATTIMGNRTMGFGGYTTPTAWVHRAAGTTAIPAERDEPGTLNTTILTGTKEYDGSHYESNSSLNRYGIGGNIYSNSTTVANSGTSATTLSTYTTKVSSLKATEEKLPFEYWGTSNDANVSSSIVVSFGGVTITTLPLTSGVSTWVINGCITRTGSSTATATLIYKTTTIQMPVVAKLTGLTFTNTNILLLTGTALDGNADGIVKETAIIDWKPVSAN